MIDPKTLPEGTVVKAWHHGTYGIAAIENVDFTLRDVQIVEAFVRVPVGMTVEDAQQALTEHVAWVPLPDGPTSKHIGARVRQEYAHGGGHCRREGELKSLPFPGAADVAGWKELRTVDADWFIHPDDVTDPDAELIEAIAVAAWEAIRGEKGNPLPLNMLSDSVQAEKRAEARAALAVVREHEAATA